MKTAIIQAFIIYALAAAISMLVAVLIKVLFNFLQRLSR